MSIDREYYISLGRQLSKQAGRCYEQGDWQQGNQLVSEAQKAFHQASEFPVPPGVAQTRPLPRPESAYEDLSMSQVRLMTLPERVRTLNGLGAVRFGVWYREEGDERPTILARTRGELKEAVRRGAFPVKLAPR